MEHPGERFARYMAIILKMFVYSSVILIFIGFLLVQKEAVGPVVLVPGQMEIDFITKQNIAHKL